MLALLFKLCGVLVKAQVSHRGKYYKCGFPKRSVSKLIFFPSFHSYTTSQKSSRKSRLSCLEIITFPHTSRTPHAHLTHTKICLRQRNASIKRRAFHSTGAHLKVAANYSA